jgi:hypothetical protein
MQDAILEGYCYRGVYDLELHEKSQHRRKCKLKDIERDYRPLRLDFSECPQWMRC